MKLGQLCKKIGSGATPRGGKEVYLNQGPVSLIRSQNVHNNEFSFSGLAYINELQARELQNVEVEENDLLLNITGDSVARICQVDLNALPARVNQHVSIIRPHPEKLDHLFLKYWFLLPATQQLLLQLSSSGATRKALTKQMLESLDIPDILLNSQKMISNLLYRFDQKIELNRKMNETLEEMAQAVFQDWFVDFGPVKRKAKGITDPVAILGGFIPDPIKAQKIASLFPDQFAEDGLPEGWVQSKLGHEFNVTMGQSPPGSTYNEINEGLPFFQGRRDFGFRFPKNRVYCNKPSRIAEKDWTLVSVRAPVGDINRSHEKSCIGRGVSTLIHKSGLASYTYYYALALRRVFENYNSNGTVFGSINKKQLEDITILAPNLSIVQTFDDLITGVDQLILNNTDQNHTLSEMRDLLLPKLMSGEISVDELEKKMGGVL